MQFHTSLTFNGRCKEAFTFYERCLGGKLQTMMTYAESPMADRVPPEWGDKIIHTALKVGEAVLMGDDSPPGYYEKPAGFWVTIELKDQAEVDRIFKELSQNGRVVMPLQETFWSPRFGMVVDRFDIPWMINCEKAS